MTPDELYIGAITHLKHDRLSSLTTFLQLKNQIEDIPALLDEPKMIISPPKFKEGLYCVGGIRSSPFVFMELKQAKPDLVTSVSALSLSHQTSFELLKKIKERTNAEVINCHRQFYHEIRENFLEHDVAEYKKMKKVMRDFSRLDLEQGMSCFWYSFFLTDYMGVSKRDALDIATKKVLGESLSRQIWN